MDFKIKKTFTVLFFISFFLGEEIPSKDNILVKVKDRIITKNDFIRRAEYTIRPVYCRSDTDIDKKVILNSLIAEKLMAIDVEPHLSVNNFSSNYLNGIKEQKMRDIVLKENVYNKIEYDSLLIGSHFKNAGKSYNLEFLSFSNDSLANTFNDLLQSGMKFSEICMNVLKLDTIPSKTVSYFDDNEHRIHHVIFSKELKQYSVIGPIRTKEKKTLFFKVLGWEEVIPLTQEEKLNQLNSVENRIFEDKYKNRYDDYIVDIMRGSKLQFFEDSFYALSDEYYKEYILNKEGNTDVFELDEGDSNVIDPNQNFLTLNEKMYTISDIKKLISKHPLVFRKENISKNEFPYQFKFAIVDLMKDERINEIAYKNQYDLHPDVLKEVEIFKDASMCLLYLQSFLSSNNIPIEDFNDNKDIIIENLLEKHIHSLQEEYSKDIMIDFNVFDDIRLTHIDLYAYKKGVPYPSLVPLFPVITKNHIIDYGNKKEDHIAW